MPSDFSRLGRDAPRAVRPNRTSGDRAQAYTLEGVIGSLLLLTALLFSMQSVALTPATDGAVDASVRAELQGQAADALATSAERGSLSRTVRYWNNSTTERTFAGARRPSVGYGNATPPTTFGETLERTFADGGRRFNVEVRFLTGADSSGRESVQLVYRGVPGEDAVVATRTVTLYDDDELTGPGTDGETVAAAHRRGSYPVPDAAPDSPVYNLVEVRLVVW